MRRLINMQSMALRAETEKRPFPIRFLKRITVQDGLRLLVISIQEIDWIEADKKYVRLHIGGKTHKVRRSLSELAKTLDPDVFRQIHRSHIVNLERIVAVDLSIPGQAFVSLRSGLRVAVAKSHKRGLQESLTRV